MAGFPSPAEQYQEPPLDLNELLVKRPAATFFVRVQGDSVVLNRKLGATGLSFPLGYASACDTFVFRFARMGVSDTVFIRHDNHPYFISLDCGTAMFHTLTAADCTHRLMQSAVITHPEINYDAQENIQLVFGN